MSEGINCHAEFAIQELPAKCAREMLLPGAIVIGCAENGEIICHFHGLTSHRAAVEKLAVAIHAVMSGHDMMVVAGAAGEEAKRRALEMRSE